MARKTTHAAATLTVTHQEQLTINSRDHGGYTTSTYSNIINVDKRITTITTTEAVIAVFSSVVAPGQYIPAKVKYMRFTNLDDSNFLTLTFRNQDNDEFAIKVDAGQSYIWCGDNSNGMTAVMNATQDADAASSANFGSLTNIQADADTGSCDLEIYIAEVA